jgi:hypothetical protein
MLTESRIDVAGRAAGQSMGFLHGKGAQRAQTRSQQRQQNDQLPKGIHDVSPFLAFECADSEPKRPALWAGPRGYYNKSALDGPKRARRPELRSGRGDQPRVGGAERDIAAEGVFQDFSERSVCWRFLVRLAGSDCYVGDRVPCVVNTDEEQQERRRTNGKEGRRRVPPNG